MNTPVAVRRPMPTWEAIVIVFLPLALADVLVYSILDLYKVQSGWVQAIAYIVISIVVLAFDCLVIWIWVLNKYHGGVMKYNAPKAKRLSWTPHEKLIWAVIGFVLTTLAVVYLIPLTQ